jgi:hypothetical protein
LAVIPPDWRLKMSAYCSHNVRICSLHNYDSYNKQRLLPNSTQTDCSLSWNQNVSLWGTNWTFACKSKDKLIPLKAWIGPECSRRLMLPDLKKKSAPEGGKIFSSTHRPPLPPQEIFLVLISVRCWVNTRATVRPRGLRQWKIPMTLSGIELATFRLVAQWPNQLRHRVPRIFACSV